MTMALFIAAAGVVAANPMTAQQVINGAAPGAIVKLAPGKYPRLMIRGKRWVRPVVIDASGAMLTLNIVQSGGIIVRGGTFGDALGKGPDGYAMMVRSSENIAIENVALKNSIRGLIIAQSRNVRVTQAKITGMKIDGINIASSQKIAVTDSICSDFDSGDAHPDCVQLWSRPNKGVTQDVLIARNRSIGKMQGFGGFNHVRNGVDDGGFDRITIKDNYVAGGKWPRGVFLNACRDCTITGNIAETLPGARWAVTVAAEDCKNCTVRGNQNGKRPKP